MRDKLFLIWIHERLRKVHDESPNVDYMHKLREVIGRTPLMQETPNKGSVSLEDMQWIWAYNIRTYES